MAFPNLAALFGGVPAIPKTEESELKGAIRKKLDAIIGDSAGMLSQFTGIIDAGINMMSDDDCKKLSLALIELGEELKPLIK